jgi:hypothetical protein
VISARLRWSGIVFVICLACFCGVANGQTLNVSLSSSGAQSLTAGSDFSNGGTITVTATGVASGATVTITGLTLSVSNAGVFDSLTLTGSAPSGSSAFDVPLTSGSNDATFSSIELSDGQSATFVLSGTVSSTPPTGGGLVRLRLQNVQQASVFPPGPATGLLMFYIGLAALGLLAMSGKLRRRHLAMFAVWLLMAAGVMSCGQGGSASGRHSTQAATYRSL